MTPEHLVDSAKLYDYYINGFTDGASKHTACIHLSKVTPSISSTPAWFNNPDPYDLAETDRVGRELQKTIIRSSTRFAIAEYVKLSDSKLTALISNVNTAGLGALAMKTAPTQVTTIGNPGEWSVESFLEVV